jgi:predicted peroxiredoxin
MKTFTILFSGVFFLLSSCQLPSVKNDEKSSDQTTHMCSDTIRDGVFIHITESYNDPHRVLMPLKMANMMAKDKDVLVYLDIHAVELVTKTSKDMEFADFDPLKKLLQGLIDKKVGVYACPTCMKIANIKPEDLMEGIQVASKDRFFDFTKGRIITLDY